MYRDQAFGTKDRELTTYNTNALDPKSIERYRNYLSVINTSHLYNFMSVDELLQKLQVTKEGKVTFAGLLFFGQAEKIEELIADFRIDYLEISGASLDDAPERYSFRLDQQQNIFEYYFAIYPRLLQKIDIPFKMIPEGMATEELPHVQALREALVNMLMHADYFSTSKPRVRVFTDHLEFFNPGGLPKELNVLRESDISQPRNPLIAKMFRVIKLAETAGYGFDKIFKGWTTYVDDEPNYISGLDYIDLKLTTQKTTQKTTQRQCEIINFLIKNPKASRREISEELDNITEDGVKYNLKVLQNRGLLIRIGPDKGGYWKVIDKNVEE
jgi:ATP-dependent DNA helicase RecG